ncbi:MAG: hypothetical protein AAF587_36585 [Bacteroidota bacterium]
MKRLHDCILLFLAAVLFAACSSSDPLLDSEPLEPATLALAKPIIPGMSSPPEEPPQETPEQPTEPSKQETSSSEENTPKAKESLLPPQLDTKQTLPKETVDNRPNETTHSPPPKPKTDPGKRVPSTTDSEPCNSVHKAMVTSMESEITDLQSYYETLTELIERHKIRREIREKKKDLEKYKKDHGCK